MNKRVLIVDDDAGTRQLLAELVSEFRAESYEAGTDAEAYQRYLELGPDLLFVDVLLPRHGGLELVRRIRGVRGGKDVPVLVMSAVYRGNDIRNQAVKELGAVDFLKKPFQLELIREHLGRLLAEDVESVTEAVTPFSPTEILNRGSLARIDFPLLLKDLAFHKTTGCLNLRFGKTKKILFFQDGEITFAIANQLRETLGRFLLSRGKIDEDAYREGLAAIQKEGKKLGEFLLERQLLEPRDLFDAVRENILEKILEVFGWHGGDFRLTAYRDPPAPLPGQPFEVHRVLWDGVRQNLPRERLTSSLKPCMTLAVVPQRDLFELASEVALDKEDLQFLRLLRRVRGRTLADVLSEVKGEQEARFLYYLLLRGFLTLSRGGALEGLGGRDIDAADLERIRRAGRRLDALRSRNYFQVLEVPLDASDEKVRESYLHRAKDVHPDVLGPGDPPELVKIHEETFHVIQGAYEALKTEPRRREYLKFIQEGLEEEVSDGSKILEAESRFQEGRMLLRRRDWDAAADAFADALEWNSDEGEYALHLGIARLKQAAAGRPNALQEAEELLHRARGIIPNSPEPYYRLGRIATQRGDLERAASYYQSALARNPNHVDAMRDLRLIRMRTEKKGGVLGSLLGRKERP